MMSVRYLRLIVLKTISFCFVDELRYIRLQDRRTVFLFFYVYIYINKLLKQGPVKIMGKNFKSYATTQVHLPREREGSLTAQGPNLSFKIWYSLAIHIIRF